MRLTVGPLPPAVYWRRRAVVLGALLLILSVLYASCSGSTDARKRSTSGSPAPTTTAPSVLEEPSTPAPTAQGEPTDTSEPGDEEPAEEGPGLPTPPPPPPAPSGSCTNEEMSVVPSPAKASVPRGTPMDLRLKIKNTSDRTCNRDVGADLQELRLVKGAQTVWSSDRCGTARGSDVRSFGPGVARDYTVTWNGKSSSKCGSGVPTGPVPAAGTYQLLGRLGDKYSQPVKVTLR
jgi:hypothetical protein